MPRVKVLNPDYLGPSYQAGQVLEVSADRAQRWKQQGIVKLLDPGSQEAKAPTAAEVELDPDDPPAAPATGPAPARAAAPQSDRASAAQRGGRSSGKP